MVADDETVSLPVVDPLESQVETGRHRGIEDPVVARHPPLGEIDDGDSKKTAEFCRRGESLEQPEEKNRRSPHREIQHQQKRRGCTAQMPHSAAPYTSDPGRDSVTALDPRFAGGVALLNAGETDAAADLFEDLFFEAVREEAGVARVLLQVSAGAIHLERKQRRPASERLADAVVAIDRVTFDGGLDLERLRDDVVAIVDSLARGEMPAIPKVRWR